MNNVERLHKDDSVFKIEGEAFKRVREAARKFDKEKIKLDKEAAVLNKRAATLRKQFWEVVYKEIGANLDDTHYDFNEKYEKFGFYLVEKDDFDNPFERI